jgi:hypothetical protein
MCKSVSELNVTFSIIEIMLAIVAFEMVELLFPIGQSVCSPLSYRIRGCRNAFCSTAETKFLDNTC